ncbi:MAG TPA: hypothetical protein VKZ79_00585 [Alphaproteobacteria bacterium]|nr:hypothetical protein [Alphaproteobacteria bacterium]
MSAVDLYEEFSAAASKIDATHIRRMRELGMRESTLFADRPRFGAERIQTFDSDGSYQPTDDGMPALLIADGIALFADVGWSAVEEIVAISTSNPSRWWWRSGDCPILGRALLEIGGTGVVPGDDGSVTVYDNPLAWAIADDDNGICVIDWAHFDPDALFHQVEIVRCAAPALAERLKRRREELFRPAYRITVARDQRGLEAA